MSAELRTPSGGRIDRARVVNFSFDGRAYQGFAGDTLASALLANGVQLLGRSFKYHRPRGLLAAGAEEPSALVTVRRDQARCTPNLRATQVELYEGLEAESQNRFPGLAFDLGAVNDLLSPFIPAGFYYKTFMWPAGAWQRLYEPRIRAAAGLGRAPTAADPDRYTGRFAHCDVLVVGAGPTGLAAAYAAAAAGARVMLCDEQNEPGGSLLCDGTETEATLEGRPASVWLGETLEALTRNPRVTLLTRTTAFGYFPHNLLGLSERLTDHLAQPHPETPRERQWQVRAREVVLATGAIERPLVFPGNDRPGIMLASAARTWLNRYGVLAGTRAVVVTAADEAYGAALELKGAGVVIACIADVRESAAGVWAQRALEAGVPVLTGVTVLATGGRRRVNSIELARLEAGRVIDTETQPCDLVLMSGGFTPSVHLHSQSRGKLLWDAALQAFIPGASAEHARSAGACRGVFALEAAFADGAAIGAAAARDALAPGRTGVHAGAAAPTAVPPAAASGAAPSGYVGALPQPRRARPKAFVDWQNDVTTRDLALANREGFRSIEHVKRYTTTGMATDQGKTSNLNALGIVSQNLGKTIPEVGLTTFRMPYTPVTFGSFAGVARGELFDPVRTTPMHGWAAAQGAVF
jgi:sarcosine oxidase, subunit alpha